MYLYGLAIKLSCGCAVLLSLFSRSQVHNTIAACPGDFAHGDFHMACSYVLIYGGILHHRNFHLPWLPFFGNNASWDFDISKEFYA